MKRLQERRGGGDSSFGDWEREKNEREGPGRGRKREKGRQRERTGRWTFIGYIHSHIRDVISRFANKQIFI